MNRVFLLTLFVGSFVLRDPGALSASSMHAVSSATVSISLIDRATSTLFQVMADNQNWIGIHAAEGLVAIGQGRLVHERFLLTATHAATQPHRVGIWRVLASTAPSVEERSKWIAVIEKTFLDPAAPDRKQAIESLAKLGHPTTGPVLQAARMMATTPPVMNTVLPLWSLHHSGDPTALAKLVGLLSSNDAVARQRAAYALRWIKPDDEAVRTALAKALRTEPAGTPRLFMLGTAITLDASPTEQQTWQRELKERFYQGIPIGRYDAGLVLAPLCGPDDLPKLEALLTDADHDTRVSAAVMILNLRARTKGPIKLPSEQP